MRVNVALSIIIVFDNLGKTFLNFTKFLFFHFFHPSSLLVSSWFTFLPLSVFCNVRVCDQK